MDDNSGKFEMMIGKMNFDTSWNESIILIYGFILWALIALNQQCSAV